MEAALPHGVLNSAHDMRYDPNRVTLGLEYKARMQRANIGMVSRCQDERWCERRPGYPCWCCWPMAAARSSLKAGSMDSRVR